MSNANFYNNFPKWGRGNERRAAYALLPALAYPLDNTLGDTQTLTQQVAAICSNYSDCGWYDPSDLTTTFQDRSTTPTTAAGFTDVVGTVLDKSGNGFHAIAPSDGARATLTQSGGLTYLAFSDDRYVSDGMDFEPVSGTESRYFACGYDNDGETNGIFMARNAANNPWVGVFMSGNASTSLAGSPATLTEWRIDQTALSGGATRGDVYDLINGAPHVHEIDFTCQESGQPAFTPTIGGYAGGILQLSGKVFPWLVFKTPPTESEKAVIANYLAEKSGVTL